MTTPGPTATTPPGLAAVHLRGVSRSFPTDGGTVRAVRAVDLLVQPGAFACVYGRSGSGKSTLLNLVAGLDVPDAGSVLVGGVDVTALDEEGRARLRLLHVGVVFQDHNLVEEFTAEENVALPAQAAGIPRGEALAQARAGLARVGLGGLERRLPTRMSGGQRQRVGIARALVGQRSLLLADEPTGALDSATSRDLFALLRELCDEGMTAVVATHDPLARDHAHTVYAMVDGCLFEPEQRAVPGSPLPQPSRQQSVAGRA